MSTTGTPDAGATSGLFTRQSSGLVRELGIPAATAIALASVAVVNTFINFSAGLTSFSHPDMILPLLLAAGIWFVGMFAYRYLLQAIPRAGGEYVYVSRVISPVLGAMVGVSVAVAFTYILAANAQFTAELGKALHRPTVLPVPGFALKLLFGEMAGEILGSQRVIPKATEKSGYRFRYPELGPALAALKL